MAWGRGRGKGREGAEGVDVDYALDIGNVSTARATSLGAPCAIDEDGFHRFQPIQAQ
jgi:hypothetical protein